MVFEPRAGGHVYDRGADGSECRWARVLVYEPPHRLVISWDVSLQWQLETDHEKTSEVEVRFTAQERAALGSSSSTATSTATEKDGSRCATPSVRPAAGQPECARSPSESREARHRDHHEPRRSAMHAVLIEVNVSEVGREAGLQGLREQIVPAISQLPGFQSGTWLTGNEKGNGLSLTLWDTEANAQVMAERFGIGSSPQMSAMISRCEVREVAATA